MEDAQHKSPQLALRSFDERLGAGVEALKDSGRWVSLLQAGGSSREMLGQPSPPVQVCLILLGMGNILPVIYLRIIKTAWDDTKQNESEGSVNECHQRCPIEEALGSRSYRPCLSRAAMGAPSLLVALLTSLTDGHSTS